jgi:hypothetical protein
VSIYNKSKYQSGLPENILHKKDSEQVGMTGKKNILKVKKALFSCFLLVTLHCSLFTLFGCGYSLHGRASLPFDAIQIGTIENKTVEPKLQDRLYIALTEEFLKQGITVSPDAGYKLSGTIKHFSLLVLSEKGDVAAEYEITMKGDFTLIDPSGKKKELKDIGSPFIVSFSGAGPLEELIASKELASEKAIRDMAMQVVGAVIYQ